ncbi:F-box protein DOR [Brassica rapa]|uniref:F-box protein DOR n=1 Tax=Brassica campestris TaxID=3711 RepID=UPI0004F17D69|nr:F-box protein DOR [Brassica rapa]
MKTRRQHAAENALTISRRSTQSPLSIGNSETIPTDLIIEVLLRLPPKSIPKCRCASKLWDSILRRADFTELFITRSRARPQLLLSCVENEELFLFSIPQEVQNQDVVTANYHTRFPCGRSSKIIGPVRGLVCLTHLRKYKKTAPVICNPSTGQSLPLPNVKTRSTLVNTFLGFDPVGKQFKILSMTTRDYINCEEHQVLTLGTEKKMSWRKIECSISHYFRHINHGICINGVVYYVAGLNEPPMANGIVCFDVRSEKFKVINRDAEKHEWSKHISICLPLLWNNIVANATLFFVGVTGTDEIVLSPKYVSEPYCFYVYYYNIESNAIRRVEIQGMDAFRHCQIRLSLNHVEDVKLLQYI